ncbi:hypothetical protein MMC10_011229, partial [Thelotrema lepadinum]|nr:hypothetical protein [Thelotrema lepadinum]
SPNASVKIGLTLSTSSPTLCPSSLDLFYVIVSARILATPEPSRPVTLQTHPSPLADLSNRSFHNITCIANPAKHIEIFPRGWPQYHWDMEDLRSAWSFVTIPPLSQGSYVVSHEVPRSKIVAADLRKGEHYRVRLTDKCLGTPWWAFKSLNELDGVRLSTWRDEFDKETEESDPDWAEDRRQEIYEKFGDRPSCMGEEPGMLAMVVEESDAEFEIV